MPRLLSSGRRVASLSLAAGLLAGVALALACGAQDTEAPAPPPRTEPSCRNFDELMPRFTAALETGKTEGLRLVIQNHLLKSEREGVPPPITDVLRSIFVTLARFAALPPEPGALAGQTCAETPPELALAHPLCEMRRAMDTLVHEGAGLRALELADPQLLGVMRYIVGGETPDGTAEQQVFVTPHYEVAEVVSRMCAQNANCQMSDTLDLVIALTTFLETPEGTAMLERANTMVQNPALQPFLRDDGADYGGENGIVALVDVVITTTLGMDDPSDLDALPINSLPDALRPDAQALLADLKTMLDPKRSPNVLAPTKKALNCFREADKNRDLVRMLYRLGLEAKLPEFGLTTLVGTANDLRQTDQRGTLVHLANTLAKAVRQDEQAIDSAAKVCATMFSTRVSPGESKSPAENAMPVMRDLFKEGVGGEAICAMDTLVYGCAAGPQPACEQAK